MEAPTVVSHSMLALFRNCRRACQWRYVEELVPLEREAPLAFGGLMHECLEAWHRDGDLAAVLDHIDRSRPRHDQDDTERREWHLARAMIGGYATRYAAEDFEVLALEQPFEGPIRNPATGEMSLDFIMAGKIDGIVRTGDVLQLLEHKTTSSLDGGYLERLWIDTQIVTYVNYARVMLGIPVVGAIYNVLVKARLRQGQTETDDTYQRRLAAKYTDPSMFHREQLYISEDQIHQLQAELWELTQQFADARDRGVFYPNTDACNRFGRTCPYLPLCRSNGNPNLIDCMYRRVPPHEELNKQTQTPTEKE
jgi:hypothetical protein